MMNQIEENPQSCMDYDVTLFHCMCIFTDDRQKAVEVFLKTMNAILETPLRVLEMQKDYNFLLNPHAGAPYLVLPAKMISA